MARFGVLGAAASAAVAAGAVLVQAARLRRAARLARQYAALAPFVRLQPGAPLRVLLLGDSTGVGVGCDPCGQSIGAQLARDWPQAEIVNACVSGARVADTLQRVRDHRHLWRRFDLVVLQVGGNDVLRLTGRQKLRQGLHALLGELNGLADAVVWAGLANVGRAPLFIPPFSWLLEAHARRCCRLFAQCAAAHGVPFIDFFREPGEDPFSADAPRYYARDGLHPSGEAYAYCYRVMRPVIARLLRRFSRQNGLESAS